MSKPNDSPQYLLWGAAIAIVLAPFPALISQIIDPSTTTRTGLFCLTFALLAFGIGETLNHPAHTGNRYIQDSEPNRFIRFAQRRRLPCALGNLLFVLSLLLFFIGIGKIIAT